MLRERDVSYQIYQSIWERVGNWTVMDKLRLLQDILTDVKTANLLEIIEQGQHKFSIIESENGSITIEFANLYSDEVVNDEEIGNLLSVDDGEQRIGRQLTQEEILTLQAEMAEHISPPLRAVPFEEIMAMSMEVENPVALEDEKDAIADYLWEQYLNVGVD